ncbi:SMP-30/gluconolactonase/LRE family protein [Sporichthya brevicatena]|uniref:SMP-30/gluconolactonase/LRE family protein n=1 Tax=Sporichthya brevicatena TaxID=171442 RepID=A0ABN1GB36_9ACTN
MTTTLTRLASGFVLLEAARWLPAHGLVFSDMLGGGVYALRDDAPTPLVEHRKGIGGLVPHADGGLVVSGRNVTHKRADGTGVVLLETAADEQFFNDLTADPAGRLYIGSVPKDHENGLGRLYRVQTDGAVDVLAEDVRITNGLAADPTGTALFHVDSPRKVIWRYALPSGERTDFVSTEAYPGVPDGIALAADGTLFVALAGGALVVAYDPVGAVIAEIEVPARLVTSVCLGGPDLRTLFVLTGVNEEYPDAAGGSVFAMPAPTAGLPAPAAAVRLA